jgi:hypothetical protein
MRRPGDDVATRIETPLQSIERLPRARASQVVGCARAALAARCREVNAMTYPNLDEVWWCDLGDGVALAVIGIAREQRLALETNTGYLLVANGVPIGYGGVTPLFRQANTGINVFDPFRGSEAAFLWIEMLRAFHTLYASRRFVINAYQFGEDNAEAIQSGAFWFYYRLGFRPASLATRKLAAREAQRMAGDRKYRSDARTLRALASGDLHLDLPGFDQADYFDEALLAKAGARAAQRVARESAVSRTLAQRNVAVALARDLGVHDFENWPPAERMGFTQLAPSSPICQACTIGPAPIATRSLRCFAPRRCRRNGRSRCARRTPCGRADRSPETSHTHRPGVAEHLSGDGLALRDAVDDVHGVRVARHGVERRTRRANRHDGR